MLATGDILCGRYRIDMLLGQGGMGGVYQATQLSLEKPFALKEMLVEIADPKLREAAVRQFRVEAQILHSLEHPGLPRLYDFFEEAGRYYLVMELVRGATLDAVVVAQPLTEPDMLRWLHEICSVLRYLHTHDPPIIFRDLKPSNLMLTQDGHVKLIDFGIAKVWDAADEETLTRTGIRGMCTAGFAAPEQYGSGTDERTDIYALGATMYSLLTRTIPPASVDIASGRIDLPPLSQVRPDISKVNADRIHWMMQLSMSRRPQTMDEVMSAFGFSQFLSPIDASPETRSRFWLGPALTRLSAGAAGASTGKRKVVAPGRALYGGTAVAVSLLLGILGWRLVPHAKIPGTPPVSAVKVLVSVVPGETRMYDNGKLLATVASATLESLPPGRHSLTFKHAGFQDMVRQVDVEHGEVLSAGHPLPALEVVLQALPGRLRLAGTTHATVTVDGKVVGILPLSSDVVLDRGQHRVRAVAPGYYPEETKVTVAPEATTALLLRLHAMPIAHHAHYAPAVYRRPAAVHRPRRGFLHRIFH